MKRVESRFMATAAIGFVLIIFGDGNAGLIGIGIVLGGLFSGLMEIIAR